MGAGDYTGVGGPFIGTAVERNPELPFLLDNWGPPTREGITIYSGTLDLSSRATAVRSTGTYLRKGLALYLIGSTSTLAPGRYTSVGTMSGNSPGDSTSPNDLLGAGVERFVGFLEHDVDMLNKETGVVAEQQAIIVRSGRIRLSQIHDRFGNSAKLVQMLKEDNNKFNWYQFMVSVDVVSPGSVSP